ncbi:hypothetical protein LDL08_36675 [Nonomuraea glycinis]|uniref:Uncharacterized protein n=1 Tax=Nonomuraea glycinis TaxID=2047744 RepID=A0A918AFC3_9ACTN|nr:hypothetical protein [Nonomuraea glycinis]MCA2181712.1 hypothetical protein [Nonomuraea glycinis]GGP14870.1 hypothetical protein GCM10012278_72350 [Nonomuraea glycinis]
MGGEQRKFELTGPQIVGSTLAAVTAAVAASYLGVTGTVIGAALVSAATTVGSAVYTHYLRRTGEKVKRHTVAAWREHAAADVADGGPSTLLVAAELAAEPSPRRKLPWARVAAAAALVFAVSMGSILAYQSLAGQTVADQITGTPRKKAERDRPPVQRDKHAEPAPQAPPTPSATASAADPSPATSPSPTPTPPPTQTPAGEPASPPTAVTTPEPAGSPSPEQSRSLPEVSADTAPPAEEPHPRRGLLRLPAVIVDPTDSYEPRR